MDLDIRLDTTFRDNRKRRKLAHHLDLPSDVGWFTAGGIIVDILLLAASSAKTRKQGVFHKWDAVDICDALRWQGNAETFVEALIDAEVLERDADDDLAIHAWSEHQEFLAQYDGYIEGKREAGRKGGVASGRSRQSGKKEQEQGVKPRSKTKHVLHCASTTRPDVDQTKPDQTRSKSADRRRSAYTHEFDLTWAAYPRKQGKAASFAHWQTYGLENQRRIYQAVGHLAEHVRITGADLQFIPHGSTFFQPNPKKKPNWEDWEKGCPECQGECSPIQRSSNNVLDRMRAGSRNLRRLTEGTNDEETGRGGPRGLPVLALPPGGSGGDDD